MAAQAAQAWVHTLQPAPTSFADLGFGSHTLAPYFANSSIQYIGVDIFKPLIEKHRAQYPQHTWKYKDLIYEPDPLPGDIWYANQVLNGWSFEDQSVFFRQFLKSKARFLLLNTNPTIHHNTNTILREVPRPCNFEAAPYSLPKPSELIYTDPKSGEQLAVWTRVQILEWLFEAKFMREHTTEDPTKHKGFGNSDSTAPVPSFLANNLPLRSRTIHDHRG